MANIFDTNTNPFDRSQPSAAPKTPFANTGLGIALNTLIGLPAAAAGVGKSIIQQGVKAITNTEQSVAQEIPAFKIGPVSYTPKASVPVVGEEGSGYGANFAKGLFGPGDQESIQKMSGEEAAGQSYPGQGFLGSVLQPVITKLQTSPFSKKLGLDKVAPFLAVGSVLGDTAIGATNPFGGESELNDLSKSFANEFKPATISDALKAKEVPPYIADTFAPKIAAANTPEKVAPILNDLQKAQAVHAAADSETQAAAESIWHDNFAEKYNALSDEMAKTKEDLAAAPERAVELEPQLADLSRQQTSLQSDFADAVRSEEGAPQRAPIAVAATDAAKVASEGKIEPIESGAPKAVGPTTEEARQYANAEDFKAALEKSGTTEIPGYKSAEDFYKAAGKESPIVEEAPRTRAAATSHIAEALGMHGIDFAQTGPEVVKAIQGAHSPAAIKEILISSGIEPKLATRLSIEMVGMKDPAEIEDALHVSRSLDATGKISEWEKGMSAVRKSAGNTLESLAEGKDGKSWSSIVKGYSQNLPKAAKVHFFDYIATPEYVLEKLGLQKGAEMLQAAKDESTTLRKEFINKVVSWKSEVDAATHDDPLSKLRIFLWLDGKARFVAKDMSATELKVAGEIKSWLAELADRMHLPEENRIADYITHIFERTSETGVKETVFDDPDMVELMGQPAKSVYDPFLEARTGKPGYKQDVWASLDAYSKRAARKIAMDPALEEVSSMAKRLDGDAYEYVSSLTHRINMRPTKIDRLIDNFLKQVPGIGNRFGDRPIAYLTSKLRSVFYRGALGLNLSSALRNLSQGANTYAKLGEKATVVGYFKVMTRMMTHNLQDLYDANVLDDAYVQDKKLGVYKTFLEKIDPVLYKFFDTAEKINRGAAFYGAQSKALDKGLSADEALTYAKRIVRETQFSFSAVDSPVALASDLAKVATQMQTYNIKQIEFFVRMAKQKDFAGFARWTLASYAFVYTLGRVFGMTPSQLLPSIGLGGNPTTNLISDLYNVGAGSAQSKASAKTDLGLRAAQLFPAGAQIRKTVQGAEAYGAGKSTTATGKTRYLVPQTVGSLLQNLLFGKSASPEAQAYFDKLNNPKSSTTGENPFNR